MLAAHKIFRQLLSICLLHFLRCAEAELETKNSEQVLSQNKVLRSRESNHSRFTYLKYLEETNEKTERKTGFFKLSASGEETQQQKEAEEEFIENEVRLRSIKRQKSCLYSQKMYLESVLQTEKDQQTTGQSFLEKIKAKFRIEKKNCDAKMKTISNEEVDLVKKQEVLKRFFNKDDRMNQGNEDATNKVE